MAGGPGPVTSWPDHRARWLVFEDEAILALNKPTGISVMGERHDTDLVRLAAEHGEQLYPVHRIDKVTSGLIVLAKDLARHGPLTRQFAERMADKTYLAITRSAGLPEAGRIELPLSVGRKSRVRIAAPREAIVADVAAGRWTVPPGAVLDTRVYRSTTEFRRLWADGDATLLAVRPVTGRRHQIRVHLAWIGHPIVGDPLFERGGTAARTALHSWRLAFDAAWRAERRLRLEAEPGPDFWAPITDRLASRDPATLLAAVPAQV